jgi:hypothetical protein
LHRGETRKSIGENAAIFGVENAEGGNLAEHGLIRLVWQDMAFVK